MPAAVPLPGNGDVGRRWHLCTLRCSPNIGFRVSGVGFRLSGLGCLSHRPPNTKTPKPATLFLVQKVLKLDPPKKPPADVELSMTQMIVSEEQRQYLSDLRLYAQKTCLFLRHPYYRYAGPSEQLNGECSEKPGPLYFTGGGEGGGGSGLAQRADPT